MTAQPDVRPRRVGRWQPPTDTEDQLCQTKARADMDGCLGVVAGADADLRNVLALVGRIVRYEARFRADGLLHFDEEKLGGWYGTVLSSRRILINDPASPLRNMSCR